MKTQELLEFLKYNGAERAGVCGDAGRLFRREAVPTSIYRIEVSEEDRARAEDVLRGKVRPVAGCGFSI